MITRDILRKIHTIFGISDLCIVQIVAGSLRFQISIAAQNFSEHM